MTQRPPKPVPPTMRKPQKTDERHAAQTQKADAAFDLWLKRGLHQIYDNVAHEPIPEEWLKLIRDDEAK